jgi:trigger factor
MSPCAENSGVKEGHHLVVDIKAQSDGEEIGTLTVTDYSMELGRNFYLPDFDSHLIGMKVDDTHRITVEMPQDFVHKNLAGKSVQFEITIKEAKERVFPNLDDDFAKDLGEYETLDELKNKIREDIQHGLDRQVDKEIQDQVVDALIERNQFDVPSAMVDNEIDHQVNQTRQTLVRYGVDPKAVPPPTGEHRDRLRPGAERSVKAGLIIKAVAEQEGIEITEEEVEAHLKERAESTGVSVDHLKDELREHNLMAELRASLLQEKTFSFLKDHAEISEEEPPPEEERETDTEKE